MGQQWDSSVPTAQPSGLNAFWKDAHTAAKAVATDDLRL
jgi:hypothetical protein